MKPSSLHSRSGSITMYVIVAIVIILAITSCCILKQTNILKYGPRWWNRHNRKDDNKHPPKFVSFEVVSVSNGATIIVSRKEKDHKGAYRRTSTLNLWGIAAPSKGDLCYQESLNNLKRLAGAKVNVDSKGKVRLAEKCDGPDEPDSECNICYGTGVDTITGETMASAEMAVWFDNHLPKCRQCRNADQMKDWCPEAQAKWKKLLVKWKDFKSIKQKCLCVGTYIQGGREVLLGIVYGEAGADLELEQLKVGFAMIVAGPNDTIPADWTAAEKAAKKSAIGIWSKP